MGKQVRTLHVNIFFVFDYILPLSAQQAIVLNVIIKAELSKIQMELANLLAWAILIESCTFLIN